MRMLVVILLLSGCITETELDDDMSKQGYMPRNVHFPENPFQESVAKGTEYSVERSKGLTVTIDKTVIDKLALTWQAADKRERDVLIEVVPTWNLTAPLLGAASNAPPVKAVLNTPAAAGCSVLARWRWATGSTVRDTVLDQQPTAPGGTLLGSFCLSARGTQIRMRAKQVDVYLSGQIAAGQDDNITGVLLSISPADSLLELEEPALTFEGASNAIVSPSTGTELIIPLPPYSQEIKLRSKNPMYPVAFLAPDLTTTVESGVVGDYSDWTPIHPAAVIINSPFDAAVNANTDVRAVFR